MTTLSTRNEGRAERRRVREVHHGDRLQKDVACPCCGLPAGEERLAIASIPVFLFPMPVAEGRAVPSRDLTLAGCRHCGHFFQPTVDRALLDVIYRRYYAHYPYDADEAMAAIYRRPFHQVFDLLVGSLLPSDARNLLEVGCSRADNLLPFADHGFRVTGIDPSPLADGAKLSDAVRLISGYYEQTRFDDSLDVIVSRFSLEHVEDVELHVDKLARDLRPGGVAIVQVPNIDRYFETGLPLFAAHEHIHYFNAGSLSRLFARHGFSPALVFHHRQPSIIGCFQKRPEHATATECQELDPGDLSDRVKRHQHDVRRLRSAVEELLLTHPRVVLYGCGMNLIWLLSDCPRNDRAKVVVVDDNPALHGKIVPGSDLLVRPPASAAFDGADAVLLTLNPVYHRRVLDRLKSINAAHVPVFRMQRDGVERCH